MFDTNAYDEMFREHYKSIQSYAGRRAPHLASDDIAAETFATAFEIWDRRPVGSEEVRCWLYAIAKFKIAHAQRSHARRQRIEARAMEAFAAKSRESATCDALAASVARETFHQLDDDDRRLVSLIGARGLKPSEIAAELNISIGAVANRTMRLRRRILAAS